MADALVETLVEVLEDVTGVEVRRVHDVPGGAEPVGEVGHAGGQALGVVKHQDLGHRPSMDRDADGVTGSLASLV